MAKKKTAKKVSKAVTVKSEDAFALVDGNLNGSALDALANYDDSNFENVALDIVEQSEVFKNDIVIPKIWLMQTMSELAKDRNNDIGAGDYVNSRSEEILLSIDDENPLAIIVLKTFKRWQTFKVVGDKKEFVSSEVMVFGKNHDYKYEFSEEGNSFTRRQVISAYVLLGKDVQKGINKPYIIDFASTSKGGGRDLVSDIKIINTDKKHPKTGALIRKGKPSYVAWFKLGKFEEKKEHDYFVKTIKFGNLLPEDVMAFLKDCYDEITSLIDSNAIEIDDRDVHDAAKNASGSKANS